MAEPILYQVRGHAAWITLNSPENHNALSNSFCRLLGEHIEQAVEDPSVRMVVLTAVGRSFCAGADLKGGGGGAVSDGNGVGEPPFMRALRSLWNCPKPVIGRIQGNAFGGGLGMIAACDLAICVDKVRLAFSEVRLGLAPSMISVYVLRKISLAEATAYFLSGDSFGAEEARRMNLVYRSVPEAELDPAVEELCDRLLLCGPRALQEVKGLLRLIPTLDEAQGLAWAEKKNLELFNSEEGREGMAAFAEKRKPAWIP